MVGHLRLAVVDDHPAISAGVRTGLDGLIPARAEWVEADSVESVLADGGDFDVVLLDLRLADGSDPEDNVRKLHGRGWPVVLYTQERRHAILGRCLCAGALGLVGKHEEWEVLAEAIEVVRHGEPYLNADWASVMESVAQRRTPMLAPREAQVVSLYATGLPLKSVARRAGIGVETAREYLGRVRRKYLDAGRPAPTKTDLYQRAVEDGLLPNPADPGSA